MSHDPDAPVDPTQDYQRALAYGKWAVKFQNAGAPDGLSEIGAWGHVARWLAQKAGTDLNVRGMGIVASDVFLRAIDVEPSRVLGVPAGLYNSVLWTGARGPLGDNARAGHRTLRGMLFWGVNRSGDKVIETWGGPQLAAATAKVIETDPDPLVRLEALKMVSQASFPVQRWAEAILPALDRTAATLAESPWDTTTRRALQKWIVDTRSRLLALLAVAAGNPAYIAPPAPRGAWSYLKHNPLLAAGVIVVGVGAVGGGVVLVRRHRRRRLAA